MPVIRISDLPVQKGEDGIGYPKPFDEGCDQFELAALGEAIGLTQFGVNIEKLLPGGKSSQRHWHAQEDELVYVLAGELVLVEDDGEHALKEGDAAGWKAGEANAHHLINRSDAPAYYIVIGTRSPVDEVTYPDIDLHYHRQNGEASYLHKDGTPYPVEVDEDTTITTI